MGNLVTKGEASKEYDAEIMTLTVKFKKEGDDTGYILKSVREQCENFLIELNNIKISPEQIQLIDGGVGKRYSSDDEAKAEKKIIIQTRVDIKLCTYIFSLIERWGKEISYDIDFDVLEKEEKSNEVLKMAVEDSRRQADTIAKSLNRTVIGVNSVNDQKYIHRNLAKSLTVENDINPEIPSAFKSDTPLSDRAALPTIEIEEDIEISWLMSD